MAIAPTAEDRGRRIAAIDAIRGVAILAMVVYHTAFDLSARDLIAVDVTRAPAWVAFARLDAGTFLMLVGWSLVLATRNGLKPKPYLRRLGWVAGAALLVTAATWWIEPNVFVFFGILHQIALASVLALPFLWLPTGVVALTAAAVIALPFFYSSPLFDWPPLWWVGLSATTPATVDYVPVFPWFGVVLAGLVLGRLFVAHSLDTPFARWRPGDRFGRAIVQVGRWSLAIYLIHQPILYGFFWAASPFLTPNETVVRHRLMGQCIAECQTRGPDAATCNTFCGCLLTNLSGPDLKALQAPSAMTAAQRAHWQAIVDACRPPAADAPPAASPPQ